MLDPAQAASFLDAALDNELAEMLPPTHEAGDVIGPYRLEESLGEGGFGTVWRASQSEPIVREVALKIIRADMDSAPAIRRFRVERQALARMEHPGIARVIDAGTTPEGELYFAMELVRGMPITQYAGQHRLSLKQRVALLIQVCRAVEHAHQKAVLHRDLKPANILVAEIDGRPVVKIIDFGIAKALTDDQALSQALALTQAGLVVGTFDYMAPEQAEPGGDANDIRVDVYALGVVLHELITCVTPLRSALGAVTAPTMQVMLSTIIETNPRRPSDELTRRRRAGSAVPDGITSRAASAVDWVVLKALARKSDDRYATAGAFAADLQNYLDDQPVSVGEPDLVVRFVRLVSRHRMKFAIGTVIVTAVAITSVVTLLAYFREAEAHEIAEQMRVHAEASERLARLESKRATDASEFLSAVLGAAGAQVNEGKNAEALRAALKKGEELVARLDTKDLLRATLQGHLASAYESMEDLTKALKLRKAQLDILEQQLSPHDARVLDAMTKLARDFRNTSNPRIALPIFKAVADRYEEIERADTREWFDAREQQGLTLSELKLHDEALTLLRGLLGRRNGANLARNQSSFLRKLATVEARAGNFEQAEARMSESLDALPKSGSLSVQQLRRATIQEALARIDRLRGGYLDAARHFDESLALSAKSLGDSHPTLIDRWIEAARCHAEAKQFDRAMEHLAKAESIAVRAGIEAQKAHCMRARAELHLAEGHDAEALAAYEKFIPMLDFANDARPALEVDVKGIIITLRARLNQHRESMRDAMALWQQLSHDSSLSNDADLWRSTLTRLIEAAEAAAKADPLTAGIHQLSEWKALLAKLNDVAPALPAP